MDDVNRLLDYLEIRSPATRQIYASMAQRRHLKKGEVLYRGGEDTTYLYFLISGCRAATRSTQTAGSIPSASYTATGIRTSARIGIENEFRLNKNLEALTDADLLFFDIRPIMKELPNSIEFLRVYAKKLEEAYTQMWQVREIMREPALVRYQWFQKAYPNLPGRYAAQGRRVVFGPHAGNAQPYPRKRG